MEVLKKIQSPDYWEAEKRYLESPGCLEQRQKASASVSSTGVISGASAVQIGDHGSPHQESSAKVGLEFTQREEVIADGAPVTEHLPLKTTRPPSGATPLRNQRSRSLASSANEDTHVHPNNGKESLERHPRLMSKNTPAAASPDLSDWRREPASRKRKLREEGKTGDGTAPKKRCLGPAGHSIPSRKNHSDNTPSFSSSSSLIDGSKERPRKYVKEGKHASRLESANVNYLLDGTASLPTPQEPLITVTETEDGDGPGASSSCHAQKSCQPTDSAMTQFSGLKPQTQPAVNTIFINPASMNERLLPRKTFPHESAAIS